MISIEILKIEYIIQEKKKQIQMKNFIKNNQQPQWPLKIKMNF